MADPTPIDPASYLIVEDGTIVANANSYTSLEELDDYILMLNYSLNKTDAERVSALLKAMDYIESFKFRGNATSKNQSLSFPRSDCYQGDRFYPIEDDEIPSKIKRAQLQAAILIMTGIDLLPSIIPGSMVIKETVGPLSTTYSDPALSGMVNPMFNSIDALLSDFISFTGKGKYSFKTIRV